MKPVTILVLSLLATVSRAAEDPSGQWVPLARQAQTLVKQGRFAESEVPAKRALQIAKSFGANDSRLATTYHLLGLIDREWGHCAEARSNYVHAIAIWKRQPNPNPHFLFNAITNLLSLLDECDDYPAAEKAYRIYKSDLERYRSDAVDDARILSIRAVQASFKKDYARSEALLRESIQIMENAPHGSTYDIAGERSNLAVVLGKEGRDEESLEQSMLAIAFFEKSAPRHPVLVASLNNAACSLASLHRKEEADRMFQRALQAAADLYGEDNRMSGKIMLSYARLLREKKESPAADAYQKRGSEAFHRSFARDSATVDAEELKTLK